MSRGLLVSSPPVGGRGRQRVGRDLDSSTIIQCAGLFPHRELWAYSSHRQAEADELLSRHILYTGSSNAPLIPNQLWFVLPRSILPSDILVYDSGTITLLITRPTLPSTHIHARTHVHMHTQSPHLISH